ncbi:MAG TPA: hypothetical protein VF531_09045 [Bacillota bacterium]
MKQKPMVIIAVFIAGLLSLSFIAFINNGLHLAKEKAMVDGFKVLMAKEEVTPVELIQYMDKNIALVSRQDAATFLMGLERIQKVNLPKWQEKFENEVLQEKMARIYRDNGWTLTDLSGIQDGDLKAIVSGAISNGFKVETAEGFFFPVIDYAFLKKYRAVLPPDMVAYIDIMAEESDKTPVKDAGLMIGWEEVVKRALCQEKFIKEYGSSAQVRAVQQLLNRYLTFALFGTNNTPLFSYETQRMVPKAKQIYQQYTWNNENGRFSALMKEYLSVLKENDFRLTSEVDTYRKKAESIFSDNSMKRKE